MISKKKKKKKKLLNVPVVGVTGAFVGVFDGALVGLADGIDVGSGAMCMYICVSNKRQPIMFHAFKKK